MIYILGILQFIIMLGICFFEIKQKSPVVFMWATLLIMFGFMHLLTSFYNYTIYTDNVIIQCSIFVIIFELLYIFTRYILIRINNKKKCIEDYKNKLKHVNVNKSSPKFILLVLVVVVCIRIYSYVQSSGGLFNTSWSSGRDYLLGLDYFNNEQILSILYYMTSGIILYFIINKQFFLSLTSIIACLMLVILTRNRIEILPVFVCIISFYIYKMDKISVKFLIFATISAVTVIYIVYGLRVFRHYGTLSVFIDQFDFSEFNSTVLLYLTTDNGELGLREDFYFFVANNNQFANFGEGHTYIRMLLVFIPTRYSLGLKPDDFAISMGSAIGMVAGGSTHPTLFGDCYANLGYYGIFLGIFWALYAHIGDNIIRSRKNIIDKYLLYSLFGVTYVIIGRGSVYNSFFLLAYGVLIILLLRYIINIIHFNRKIYV